jgi:hypothetical protein
MQLAMALIGALAMLSTLPAKAQPLDLQSGALEEQLMSCLTLKASDAQVIGYPAREEAMRTEGSVRVRMEFTGPGDAPNVDVLFASTASFEEAVRSHVRAYRLPCMPSGHAPVVAVQEFAFDPRGGPKVHWSEPWETEPMSAGGCQPSGLDSRSVRYPSWTSTNRPVNVFVRMRFDGPGEAPRAEILNAKDLPSKYFAEEVTEAVHEIRLSCAPSRRWPVTAIQIYRFTRDTDRVSVLKDLTLAKFLGAVREVDAHKVRFDLSSMGCPFDVELRLYQPYARNSVGEVGQPNPNRAAFLTWISTLSLGIPDETLNQVLGDRMRISVPCGVLDLTS